MTEQSSPTPAMLPDHARDFQRQRTAAGCFASSWRTPVSNGILVSPSSGGNTSSPWKNPVPCPNTVMEDSDNEPLELSEELKAHVDVHINYMLSIGEDPRTSRRARATLAQVLNVDASRIWHHLGQHFAPTIPAARSPAPCTSTVPSVVPFEKQPAYIQDIILAIVNDYVSKHSKPCIPGTFNPPAEDAYLCIWPDCDYSHRREAQWRRHVMLHRQQSVYVCCLCFNSNAKSDSIFRDYRKDKLLNHLTAHGLMKGDDRRERVAQASCQAVNDTYTSVCDRKQGNRACHFSSQSWSEHISHVAGHLKQEIAAAAARRSSGQSGASSGQEALDDVGAALQGARKRSSATSKRVTGGDTQASTRGRKKAKK
ncbi:hypothetical protein B0A48_00968 [Cryoendolithus antarcticus]|uniref:Uncharacterized protein n=1 Tax=Cryoendolithus antarcticus TaxID=1507870 RepID=A0A1V8TSB2_9PEZI|nr:hypothetical protein B0A48_00968 [Cryoendolithus antarcticus]